MYLKRIEKIFDMAFADALLINAQPEIFYLSGFKSPDATLVIMPGERFIVTDSRYFIQAKKEAKDYLLVDIKSTRPADILLEKNVKKVGFLDKSIVFSDYKKLADKLKQCELLGISDVISSLRMIKDDKETQNIKIAAEIADSGFSHILNYIKAGVSEKDIALELEFFMRKNGASALSFNTICASGVRSAMPHGEASSKLIEKGDFVTLDFGCVYNGYVSDMTRTVVIGKPNDEQKKIYEIVLLAQKTALKGIFAGQKASDIDALARDIIKENGYGENFGHGLGHSLGLFVHEPPSCSPVSFEILKSGMLMTVEPGIYIENFGGVRIEDLVLVKADGIENFTKSEKELIVI